MRSLITIAMMVLSISAQAEWRQWSSEDPMNDTVRKGMASALTASMKMMSFPYQDTKAVLGVSCDDTGAYMRFTNSPNLSGDTTHDGYNSIRLRVRKDNDQVRGIKFVQNWGSDQLSTTFPPMRNIVLEGQTLLVEIPWHGQGKVYFKFDLTGSSDMYKRTCHERILQDKANAEKRAKDSARREKEQAEEAKRLKDLADKRAALNNEYIAQIKDKIERNWQRPPGTAAGLECVVLVSQIPGGEVVQAEILTGSGNFAFDRSVVQAVLRSSPLPVPKDPSLFDRRIEIIFEPEG